MYLKSYEVHFIWIILIYGGFAKYEPFYEYLPSAGVASLHRTQDNSKLRKAAERSVCLLTNKQARHCFYDYLLQAQTDRLRQGKDLSQLYSDVFVGSGGSHMQHRRGGGPPLATLLVDTHASLELPFSSSEQLLAKHTARTYENNVVG